MAEVTKRRPVGVTLASALTWIVAALDVVVGAALQLLSFTPSLLDQISAPTSAVHLFAYTLILIGLLTALVAPRIARGNRVTRVLLIVLMAIRIVAAAYGLWAIRVFTVWTGVVDIALALVIILILSGKRASAFFRPRGAEPAS